MDTVQLMVVLKILMAMEFMITKINALLIIGKPLMDVLEIPMAMVSLMMLTCV